MVPASAVRCVAATAVFALAGALGCARPVDPAALGYDLAATERYRQSVDLALSGAVSPLTAVDAFYLDDGGRTVLALRQDRVVSVERPGADPSISVTASGGTVEVVWNEDGRSERGASSRVVELGRYRLAVGPQSGGARIVVHDPAAPAREAFASRPWFSADAAFIVGARLSIDTDATPVDVPTTRGLTKSMPRAGELTLHIGGVATTLTAFVSEPGTLLVPFTDTTNGAETYAVGRYVEVDVPKGAPTSGTVDVVVDFNRATNPWCAYSEFYNCPIPPRDNAVAVPVPAGEETPHKPPHGS